jgi:hypothetical protein
MSSASDESAHAKGAGASRLLLRGLSILTCLADHPEGLTLQQISKEVDIPVGTAHRVLTSLQMSGFVDRSDTTRRFALGAEARRLGTSVDEARAAPDALTAAAVETGETSFLTKLRGRSVVCVSLVESRHHLRSTLRRGSSEHGQPGLLHDRDHPGAEPSDRPPRRYPSARIRRLRERARRERLGRLSPGVRV